MRARLRDGVRTYDIDHGMMLLDTEIGRYFELNAPGVVVLRGMLDGEDAETVADRLEIPRQQAIGDVHALVDRLARCGLVELDQ